MKLGACLKKHVDRFCGKKPSDVRVEASLGVTVAKFSDVPRKGLVTELTIGLSGRRLEQPRGGRPLRHELLTCVDRAYAGLPWVEVLLAVAKGAIEDSKAFERGQVLGPAGALFPEEPAVSATALLCSSPAFFPPEFGEFECDGEAIVIVELVPITSGEAEWIRQNGWSSFFDRVNSGEVNILDLRRGASATPRT